jgi:hypothetical protein
MEGLGPLIVQQRRETQNWLDNVHTWNHGRRSVYNPAGRKFKKRELALMAQQEGFDRAGISGFPPAQTAEELLERAQAVAEFGASFRG